MFTNNTFVCSYCGATGLPMIRSTSACPECSAHIPAWTEKDQERYERRQARIDEYERSLGYAG